MTRPDVPSQRRMTVAEVKMDELLIKTTHGGMKFKAGKKTEEN